MKLVLGRDRYDADLIHAWTKRRRNAFTIDAASNFLHQTLKRKARGRTMRTRRFFGEVYVANRIPHREGYYGSFKWLTSPLFVGDKRFRKGRAQRLQEALRRGLHRHFGADQLARLQCVALTFYRTHRKALNGKKPVAPDLWLVDRKGNHRFIEVKLPGDSVAPHQLAGLAAIASCLRASTTISVEIIELHPDEELVFKQFCRTMKMTNRHA